MIHDLFVLNDRLGRSGCHDGRVVDGYLGGRDRQEQVIRVLFLLTASNLNHVYLMIMMRMMMMWRRS